MDINFLELEKRVREEEDRELAAFLKGSGEAPVIYRARGDAIKAIAEGDGPIEFVCSEESDDRAGDLVHVDGWDIAAFKRNPVLPWSHDYRLAPIGRWAKMRVEGKQLVGIATFDRNDPFAARIESKYRSRFLNAVSVGFRPTEFKEREESKNAPFRRGYEFMRQELLEVSAVSVPMHPKALRKGLALAENAPVWIFMPGDTPGAFKAVQPAGVPARTEDSVADLLAAALERKWDAWAINTFGKTVRVPQVTTTTTTGADVFHLSTTGGDAPPPTAAVQPTPKPPHGGQGNVADLSAVVAALKRVRV